MSLILQRHVCKMCNKDFPRASVLRDHENVHSGVKPYSCKRCRRSFANHGSRHQHERIHLKGQHVCACGRAFKRPQELRRHQGLGRIECQPPGTDAFTDLAEDDQMDMIVSKQAQILLSNTSVSAGISGCYQSSNYSHSYYPYFGSPQSDLCLTDETVIDRCMGSFRAIFTMTIYVLRFVAGDITENSLETHVQESSDMFHRMVDHLARTRLTIALATRSCFFLWDLCTQYYIICTDRTGGIEALGKSFKTQHNTIAKQERDVAPQGNWHRDATHTKLSKSLIENSPELQQMANALYSNVDQTMRSLPPATSVDVFAWVRWQLMWLILFVTVWDCSTGGVKTVSKSWKAIDDLALQLKEGKKQALLQAHR